jgi:hypothetical protein
MECAKLRMNLMSKASGRGEAGTITAAKATDALGVPAARETNDRSDHGAAKRWRVHCSHLA